MLRSTLRAFQSVAKRQLATSTARLSELELTEKTEFTSFKPSTEFEPEARARRPLPGANHVELIGGVAADPLLRSSRAGKDYCLFNVITNIEVRRVDGSLAVFDDFHSVVCYGALVRFVQNNVRKGTRVVVNGRISYMGGNVDENTGQRTPRTASIIADIVQPLARAVKRDE